MEMPTHWVRMNRAGVSLVSFSEVNLRYFLVAIIFFLFEIMLIMLIIMLFIMLIIMLFIVLIIIMLVVIIVIKWEYRIEKR